MEWGGENSGDLFGVEARDECSFDIRDGGRGGGCGRIIRGLGGRRYGGTAALRRGAFWVRGRGRKKSDAGTDAKICHGKLAREFGKVFDGEGRREFGVGEREPNFFVGFASGGLKGALLAGVGFAYIYVTITTGLISYLSVAQANFQTHLQVMLLGRHLG